MIGKNLNYRINRMASLKKKWNLKFKHPLILEYKIPKYLNKKFQIFLKSYISKAFNINYQENDNYFLKKIEKKKSYRKNVTPNGAVVPKREYNLEYNLLLKTWCEIIKEMTNVAPKELRFFRMTPNIRIKFGKDLKDNLNRGLNTSRAHSDAWVEGPWGMNCFAPIFGDYKNNNLLFYEPKQFDEKYLVRSESYLKMKWVMDHYKKIKFLPKPGNIYISDYAMIHNTNRNRNSKIRISIDSTVFVDKYNNPPLSRIKEYRKFIPELGFDEIVDSGQFENEKYSEKKNIFSHYTSKSINIIKL